jgi:CRISPR/Cas system-associated endonuclease Cas1
VIFKNSRYLIDDFVIQYCRKLDRKDFTVKSENFSTKRKGEREYLNDPQTHDFVKALDQYFQTKIRMPRVRKGEQQEIETLINEEALLLAQYLRNDKNDWNPRIANLN